MKKISKSLNQSNFKKMTNFLPIALILLLSLAARIYLLGRVPNGISPDEADIGYNAFSILKTGKNIYGETLPLFFRSFDGFVTGFAVYSKIPAIALFGLSDFSIRLMSAILGTAATITVFFLIKLLYPKDKYISYIAGLAFAISPWAVEISRIAFGHIEMVLFYLLFLLFLVLSQKNVKWLFLAAIFLGLSVYAYTSAIIYLPLLLLATIIIYKKKISENLKISTICLLILIAITLPAACFYLSQGSRSRLSSISVLTPDVTLPTSISEMNSDLLDRVPLPNIIHNRRLVYLDELAGNYLKYFNLDYLFVNASAVRYFYINYVGLFLIIELPFFVSGLFLALTRRSQSDLLLLAILLIGPIPAILTLGTAYPHRALLMLLGIQLISAVGINHAFCYSLKAFKKNLLYFLISCTILLYSINVYFFLHQYFVHSPQEFTTEKDNGAWFATVKNTIPFINKNQNNYNSIIFTWAQPKLVPESYFLFYNQVDPLLFQSATRSKISLPYQEIYSKLEKIEFRPINWQDDKNLQNALLVGYPSEFPKDISNVVGITHEPNGNTHFLFVAVNPNFSSK